jgi:hypothetical protein
MSEFKAPDDMDPALLIIPVVFAPLFFGLIGSLIWIITLLGLITKSNTYCSYFERRVQAVFFDNSASFGDLNLCLARISEM